MQRSSAGGEDGAGGVVLPSTQEANVALPDSKLEARGGWDHGDQPCSEMLISLQQAMLLFFGYCN